VKDGLTDPDDVSEPPDEAVTQPGDLWILGEHRLLCGDSSKPEDVDRLLAEHLASEYRVKTECRGRTMDEWQLRVAGMDNHWLNGLVGAAVAGFMTGVVLFGMDGRQVPRPKVRLSMLRRAGK
jgi:hypothetical protein